MGFIKKREDVEGVRGDKEGFNWPMSDLERKRNNGEKITHPGCAVELERGISWCSSSCTRFGMFQGQGGWCRMMTPFLSHFLPHFIYVESVGIVCYCSVQEDNKLLYSTTLVLPEDGKKKEDGRFESGGRMLSTFSPFSKIPNKQHEWR